MAARVTRSSAARLAASQPPSVAAGEQVQLSSPPATSGPSQNKKKTAVKTETNTQPFRDLPSTPNSSRRRNQQPAVKNDDGINKLPHNLDRIPNLPVAGQENGVGRPTKRARKTSKTEKGVELKTEDAIHVVTKATATSESPQKKAKNNTYGLTPGQSPYPNWPHPTVEECQEVTRLLSSVHGEVKPPETIPMPSLNVSGCGEVPSVLDALIRTRLSAATSGTNSSRAFAGLVAKFGILQEGVGKGSVDWNKVRLADTRDIFEAIKIGGLADVKSKDIKKILQMVWEENQARRSALVASSKAPSIAKPPKGKNTEIVKAEENVLSLDHLHLLSNDDAFNALTKYPGIGPKTASCVLLFCLQRPSFAVDTHVFRLCKWLGWVPAPGDPAGVAPGAKGKFAGPNRNSTYAHCEVRIPDELKYPLHQLFITHGKTCPRCRAITGKTSMGWEDGCVIDHLLQRTGGRKGSAPKPRGAKPRTIKGKKRSKGEETEN
ncbi:DNA glycosylase [Lojkania enalia]|uniref:DNA glycosylase n=1 Tax=Lojkania enalia TaxID=147567 RepID=A0A9P4KES2_9PLEO|nr:DNA glycosylase [Didymosphaeria enalia]